MTSPRLEDLTDAALFIRLQYAKTDEELERIWKEANRRVGNRAPAEDMPLLIYGIAQGRRDQIARSGR